MPEWGRAAFARAGGLANGHARVCDAGALPFADASFDVVLCRFGFMFFPDIAAAARGLAGPGGGFIA